MVLLGLLAGVLAFGLLKESGAKETSRDGNTGIVYGRSRYRLFYFYVFLK
jgi:hypothetical protein